MKVIWILLVIFLIGKLSNGEMLLNLNSNAIDETWMVWNQNESIKVEATVPGGIYSDLQSSRILDDNLFYRFNDINYRWVARDNWTYFITFNINPEFLDKQAINLVLHGVDTIGDIYLNSNFLASVNNMFVRYVLPIKGLVKEKNNSLKIYLKSPISEAKRLSTIQEKEYSVPPKCTPDSYNGECHVNFLRKMQASFSWDWGPAFPSVGIWKPIEIEAYNLGIIRNVQATTIKINQSLWEVKAKYHVEYVDENIPSHITRGYLSYTNDNNQKIVIEGVINNKIKDPRVKNGYTGFAKFLIQEGDIKLWWPNGFQERNLYTLELKIESLDGTESSSKTVRVGLRTIELIQEEILPGKEGLSFYFKVNGVPIFAKGSNWIPGHILPELSYDERMIRQALQSAAKANMNMLRVWGGGLYESEIFYEVADEQGILIWQDMMFACSMYPTNKNFLESVKMEIQQQIRRLQHHSSIALWAGNNENEAALIGDWYGTNSNFNLYKQDYVKLYVDTIRSVIMENDESRAFVTSSPSNGIKSDEEGYVSKNPYSAIYGDVHYYNYFFDGWIDYAYPDTRFASEYGFQSMPSFWSISKVSLPSDRNLNSNFTKKRQHLPNGNNYMINLIKQQLPLPDDDGSETFYKTFIYYSQISQAMSTKTETEKYRRDRNKLTLDNRGHTMGAMYWQLNDVWQAPSWSSIEFGGKWKMLHYYSVKFFSPILVSPERTSDGRLNVYLISDLLNDVNNVQLNITVFSWDSFTPRKIITSKVLMTNASAMVHSRYMIDDLLKLSNCDKYNCFLYFTAEGPDFFSDNVLYPSKLKEIKNLNKPNLKVEVSNTMNLSEVVITVTTDLIAPFVWLETEETGEFSDNGFMLLKPTLNLTFTNPQDQTINVENLKATLQIRSLL